MKLDKEAYEVVSAVSPFGMGRRGEKLKEAADEVLQRHGPNKTTDQIMSWVSQTMYPYRNHYQGIVEETVPFYAALHQWAKAGCPHFSLTNDFFSAVALTDFGDPTDEPLYMPFDAFTMSFPPSDFLGGASKLMVYRMPRMVINKDWSIEVVSWKHYRATLLKDNPIFSQWPIGFTRKQLAEESAKMDAFTEDHGVRPLYDDEKRLPLRMRTMLANVMSYIESQGPLPTVPRARKGAAPAAVELTHHERPIYDVGRIVKLDGGLRKAMAETAGDGERWHVAQRFVVRGHWRNQAYGEGRTLRRRKWIEPHWKGPENAVEAINRTYEVT
jgi:hypothetical protein